ncbi:hypothetical protein L9F63_003129, partial [Diploptera punctata]
FSIRPSAVTRNNIKDAGYRYVNVNHCQALSRHPLLYKRTTIIHTFRQPTIPCFQPYSFDSLSSPFPTFCLSHFSLPLDLLPCIILLYNTRILLIFFSSSHTSKPYFLCLSLSSLQPYFFGLSLFSLQPYFFASLSSPFSHTSLPLLSLSPLFDIVTATIGQHGRSWQGSYFAT